MKQCPKGQTRLQNNRFARFCSGYSWIQRWLIGSSGGKRLLHECSEMDSSRASKWAQYHVAVRLTACCTGWDSRMCVWVSIQTCGWAHLQLYRAECVALCGTPRWAATVFTRARQSVLTWTTRNKSTPSPHITVKMHINVIFPYLPRSPTQSLTSKFSN
jgi:hypothetical protein